MVIKNRNFKEVKLLRLVHLIRIGNLFLISVKLYFLDNGLKTTKRNCKQKLAKKETEESV
jgi:hypothetical protein